MDKEKIITTTKRSTYVINNKGEVWSTYHGNKLKPDTDKDGYKTICIDRIKYKIHRLVLENFVGKAPSPLHVCRHLDGNPSNNNLSNLCWGTSSENWDDRRKHKRGIGESHGRSKLTEKDILYIRTFPKKIGSIDFLRKKFKVSRSSIEKVLSKKVWCHI